jgi:hypothetical protein
MAPTWRYPVSSALSVTFSVISGGLHFHLQIRHGVQSLNDDLLQNLNIRLINLMILVSAVWFIVETITLGLITHAEPNNRDFISRDHFVGGLERWRGHCCSYYGVVWWQKEQSVER